LFLFMIQLKNLTNVVHLWNNLPQYIRDLPSNCILKSRLKTYYNNPVKPHRIAVGHYCTTNLVCTTRFWNTLHRVRSMSKDWKDKWFNGVFSRIRVTRSLALYVYFMRPLISFTGRVYRLMLQADVFVVSFYDSA
jgi:hypothetical protein